MLEQSNGNEWKYYKIEWGKNGISGKNGNLMFHIFLFRSAILENL